MSATFQPSLVNVLPRGVWHFQAKLSLREQEVLRECVRAIARVAPLMTPQMPGGTEFLLKLTNAGEYGWCADGQRFFYAPRQATGRAWPPIPQPIMAGARNAAHEAGFTSYAPNACLINYYESGKGRLGLHRDDTQGEDFTQPIVTISLGASAVFRIGGQSRKDPQREIELQSGDVLVMGADGRMLFHQVVKVCVGTSGLLPKGGRLSLTLRQVRFNQSR